METSVTDLIYDGFFRQLEATDAWGPKVAEALRRLYAEGQIQRDRSLVEIYRQIAEEGQ